MSCLQNLNAKILKGQQLCKNLFFFKLNQVVQLSSVPLSFSTYHLTIFQQLKLDIFQDIMITKFHPELKGDNFDKNLS